MNLRVPTLHLSHGQLAWTLCLGALPPAPRARHLMAQLRYLRQLEIPFREATRGKGRGHPIAYTYAELVEVAVGLRALHRNVQPHLIRDFLLTNRTELRHLYHRALEDQPEQGLQADWVKSRGKLISVLEHEHFLRLHNRYSDTPGHYEIVVPNTATTLDDVFGLRERFADGATVVEIPLTRLVLELVYWAQQAPVIRPGRRTKAHQSPTPSKEHT